jgi:hypothetical protein
VCLRMKPGVKDESGYSTEECEEDLEHLLYVFRWLVHRETTGETDHVSAYVSLNFREVVSTVIIAASLL